MAYGRLDVFWPDGLFKTYLLSDSSISIGRSSGSTIALDTDTLSRYHASLHYEDGEVQITDLDSANGTFVDGVRLNSNEPRVLYGGEEITIGELRLIYHFLDESPTRPITIPEEVTRRIELEDAPFFIEIEEPEIAIPPGAHISARITITNTGSTPERFRVEVSGVPKDWARIDRPDLEVAPQQGADVIVNFKPRRRSDSAPGNYVIHVVVYPKNKPDLKLKGSLTLVVLPYGGFGVALERNRLKPSERFRLHLHNQGSAPLPINLIARDLGDSLTFVIPNSHLTLAPGQRTIIQGAAKPRNTRFFGDAREHSFDLITRSGDAAAFTIAARAYVDEKPPLPSWSAFALAGIAAVVLIMIAIGLVVLLQPAPAQPAITSFAVSPSRLAQGESLVVNWTVADTDEIRITVNGVPITADPQAQTAQIDTSSLHGAVTVVLTALSGTRQAETSETVQVFEPITISNFTVDPPQMVLYVAQSMTISWDAPGAITTSVTGLENFTSTPLDPSHGASANVTVVGIPRGPLTLTLAAQNPDTTVQRPLTIEMIAPQCTASDGDASLRASPDPRDQVIATIPQGTTIVVDAQDAQSQWLRVQLTGGAHGWGERTAFACANTFSVDDLYKELIIPTAQPEFTIVPTLVTPVPAPSATPTVRSTSTQPRPTTAPTLTRTPTLAPTSNG